MSEVVVMGEPEVGRSYIQLVPYEPQPRYVEFDGRRFFVGMLMPVMSVTDDHIWMTRLDMAYRARRGDAAAVATLTAFGVRIPDADGHPYWPVPA